MNPNSYGFGNVDCLLFILHLTQLYSLLSFISEITVALFFLLRFCLLRCIQLGIVTVDTVAVFLPTVAL